MKRIPLIIILLACLLQTASSQEDKYPMLWKTFVSIGYANAASSNVSEYYDLIVDSYRHNDIPILTQTPFGRTVLVNAGFLFTRLEDIWFGLSVGYSYSPAFSNYEDYAGTLKVNGSVNSFEISIKFQYIPEKIAGLPIIISAQPGISYASSSITQELRSNDFPELNYDSKWSTDAWGPCFQGTIGTSVPWGKLSILLEGGYRFSWNKVFEEKIESSAGNSKRYEALDIGQTGIVFLLTVNYEL
jgi:hypothetical protein